MTKPRRKRLSKYFSQAVLVLFHGFGEQLKDLERKVALMERHKRTPKRQVKRARRGAA